jgi:hypothetical protein
MPNHNYDFGDNGKVLTGTAQGTTPPASGLFFLKPGKLQLPNGVVVNWPGAGHDVDLVALTATVNVTDKAGTNPTLTTVIQGTTNPFDNNTTVATTALTAVATTVTLTERTGIAQNTLALLIRADGSAFEWVQVTSSATTGAGAHTIVRGLRGTVATTFPVGSYLYFTNSWAAIPTNDATTTTLTTGAVDISGAAPTTPVQAVIDTNKLDLTGIPYPVIRLLTTVGGTSTPTATYTASLVGRERPVVIGR